MRFHRVYFMPLLCGSALLCGCGRQELPPRDDVAGAAKPPQPAPLAVPAERPRGTVTSPAPGVLAVPDETSRRMTSLVTGAASAVSTSGTAPTDSGALSSSEIGSGLKQALAKGVERAVAELGKEGGYLNNAEVKIPMPPKLQAIDKALRQLGQNKIADDFTATINHAAERAVPEAAPIFIETINRMTIANAATILTGAPDSATQYFRKTTEAPLTEKFLPIVKEATQQVGVTAAYKNLTAKAGPAGVFLTGDAGDLDAYVTREALDGLYLMIAAEEARIRANPAARTTALMQKVFQSVKLPAPR